MLLYDGVHKSTTEITMGQNMANYTVYQGQKDIKHKKKKENRCITGLAVHQHANHSESGDVCDSLITQTSGITKDSQLSTQH